MKSAKWRNADAKPELQTPRESPVRMKSAAFTQVLVNSPSVRAAGFSRPKAPFITVMNTKKKKKKRKNDSPCAAHVSVA